MPNVKFEQENRQLPPPKPKPAEKFFYGRLRYQFKPIRIGEDLVVNYDG